MISIPSKWAKKYKLDKGDEIDLEEREKELILTPEPKRKTTKKITIDMNDENNHDLRPILTHAYRKGFDKIVLKGKTEEIAKEAREISVNMMLGFEVTERNTEHIILENISEPEQGKYDIMMKKVFMVIRELHEITVRDLEDGKFPDMVEMRETTYQLDKFLYFCRRILTKNKSERDVVLEWEFSTFLMHIGHAYYYLYKYAHEKKVKSDKKMKDLFKELEEYFNLYYKAYEEKDINAVHRINKLKTQYQFGKCLDLIAKSKGKESVIYSYMKDIFRLLQIGTSPILVELLEKRIEN